MTKLLGKNTFFLFLGIVFVFVLTFPLSALAGIVPCGTSTTEMCTLCHLVVGVDTIIDYLLGLIGIVGILMLVIGGITYLVSAGNQKMMTSAKTAIFSTLAGFAIVLLAWVVVNTVITYLPVKDDLGIGVSGWSEYTCGSGSGSQSGDSDSRKESEASEGDRDGDGVSDEEDNCPLVANEDQKDADSDGIGDVCEDSCVVQSIALQCEDGVSLEQLTLDTSSDVLPDKPDRYTLIAMATSRCSSGGKTKMMEHEITEAALWESANPSVAVVDSGEVVAVAPLQGQTTIRVSLDSIVQKVEVFIGMCPAPPDMAMSHPIDSLQNGFDLNFFPSASAQDVGCDVCVGSESETEKTCQFLYGNENAENIFVFAPAEDISGKYGSPWIDVDIQMFLNEIDEFSEYVYFVEKFNAFSDKFGVYRTTNVMTIDAQTNVGFSTDVSCPIAVGYIYVMNTDLREDFAFAYKSSPKIVISRYGNDYAGIIAHEVGHAFIGLDDEYEDVDAYNEYLKSDQLYTESINCRTTEEECKTDFEVPQCFPGCKYAPHSELDSEFFRETWSSIMTWALTGSFSPYQMTALEFRLRYGYTMPGAVLRNIP
jgi:hypothetical protein